MKKTFYIFLIFLFAYCCETRSQTNLVYNGDFEIYSSCPVAESSPFQAPNYEITKCMGWTCPTYGTSDYFNVCSTNPLITVPSNGLGIQLPYSGNGYVGGFFSSYTGGSGTDGYSGIMWWEYIQGQFIQPLTANRKYKISMHISLAEYSDLYIKEIGAYMSVNPITSPNTAALNVIPQVKFHDNKYFRDTVNWVKVEGEFTAAGGEKYITLGNYNNNMRTDTLRRYYYPGLVSPFVTYFYIDGVSTYDITDSDSANNCNIHIPNVFSPNADDVNDLFKFQMCDSVIKTSIYNRWGLNVFQSDQQLFWDGNHSNGIPCVAGTYYYIIQTETNIYKGFLELIR